MRRMFLFVILLISCGCEEITNSTNSDSDRLEKIATLIDEGKSVEATPKLQNYVKAYPRDDMALTILGHTYCDIGNYDEARVVYQSALDLNPKQLRAYMGMGNAYRLEKEYNSAKVWYKRAIEVDATYAAPYSQLFVIAMYQHDDKIALDYAKKSYELDNVSKAVSAGNLAVAYHCNNDVENRDKYTEIAVQLGYRRSALEAAFSGKAKLRD